MVFYRCIEDIFVSLKLFLFSTLVCMSVCMPSRTSHAMLLSKFLPVTPVEWLSDDEGTSTSASGPFRS